MNLAVLATAVRNVFISDLKKFQSVCVVCLFLEQDSSQTVTLILGNVNGFRRRMTTWTGPSVTMTTVTSSYYYRNLFFLNHRNNQTVLVDLNEVEMEPSSTHVNTCLGVCGVGCLAGLRYYMAVGGTAGSRREQARLKLLLTDGVRQGAFCVRFSYRITAGLQTGSLRVMTENTPSHHVLWEQRRSLDDGWHTENVDVYWSDRAPESVTLTSVLIH